MSAPLLYDNVDHHDSENQTRLIQMLDAQNLSRDQRRIKQEMVKLLETQPGLRVLDVGAGTGDDTRELHQLVQPGGSVVGIDNSDVMVAEAIRRAERDIVPVSFQQADVHDLPFDEASFDRVWSERTLLWLDDPRRALQEMIRVTRPGGRLVISTYDIGTGVQGGFEPELNERIEHLRGIGVPSPRIGRELSWMVRTEGLIDIVVRPQLVQHETNVTADPIRWITKTRVDNARRNVVLTDTEADRFLRSLDEAIERGTFFNVVIAFIVAGTKPLNGHQALYHRSQNDDIR